MKSKNAVLRQSRAHCSNRFDTGSNFNEETELSWLSVVVGLRVVLRSHVVNVVVETYLLIKYRPIRSRSRILFLGSKQ